MAEPSDGHPSALVSAVSSPAMTSLVDPTVTSTPGPLGRAWLWGEVLGLFIGIPLVFRLDLVPMAWLMPSLLLAGLICLIGLLIDSRFDNRRLWRLAGLKSQIGRILAVFVLGASLVTLITLGLVLLRRFDMIDLDRAVSLFALIDENPLIWAAIMVLYPLLSVYPQELVYRAFFFHRYRGIFADGWPRVIASALAFSWAHVVFRQHVSVPLVLTLVGGLFFAWTYHRSRSLAAAWLEHSLYGCYVFTIGLGWLFYGANTS